jgi:excisionase family DNA binding protein
MTALQDWSTPPEIAKWLRIRESKVGEYIRAGKLAAIDIGTGKRPRYRIARTALDDFLAAQAVPTECKPPARRQRRDDVPRYV